ncbi:MAG: hypothetical protein SCALA702_22440 [Melioribacteraceae bacterium]|nr:MAG: hypothetical protein SCALA702_22440 [Melioribacteraceae bacterium]
MKYSALILLCFAFMLNAQEYKSPNYVTGSLYYTGSNATHGRTSGSISGYLNATIGTYNYLLAGYDNLDITHNEWDYSQKMYIGGGGLSLYPIFIKAHYGKIRGDFSAPLFDLFHKDRTTLYNADLLYYTNWLVFRGSYTYEKITENANIKVNQYGVGVERYLGKNFYISLFGFLSDISTLDKLYSLKAKLTYFPMPGLSVSLETFIGKRAFFFHNDYLTIFNQGVIQESLYSLRAEYYLNQSFLLIGNLQYTEFEDHVERYLVTGIKYIFSY